MKKTICMLLALFLLAALCACGTEKAEAPADTPVAEAPAVPVEAPEEAPAKAPIVFEPVSAQLGDFYVTILGAEQFTDSDDKDAVRFYYDFTNNSDVPTAAWWDLYYDAEEDGYELVSTYAWSEDDVPEYGNDTLSVQPGITIRCIEEYAFRPDGGELIFTVSDYDDNVLTATFDPANLPGRPGDWSLELIPDPQYYADYPTEGEIDDGYYAITGSEVVPQFSWFGDGNVIRIFFDYTNYQEDAAYIGASPSITVFQDGVALVDDSPEEDLDSDALWYEDIPSGESAVVSRCWLLRTDSPVEVAVTDWWTDEVVCAAVFTVD